MRVATEEYPWLPIWVATLYFRAALASSRASQIVAVSGFWQWTPMPRSIAHTDAVACMKSGMVTVTPSRFLCSLSSISRKSR